MNAGVTVTVTGISPTTTESKLVVFAGLVAVIVTNCCAVMVAGAVYNPVASTDPAPAGLTDQVTLSFAVNCCGWPPCRVAVGGLIATCGSRVIAAVFWLEKGVLSEAVPVRLTRYGVGL